MAFVALESPKRLIEYHEASPGGIGERFDVLLEQFGSVICLIYLYLDIRKYIGEYLKDGATNYLKLDIISNTTHYLKPLSQVIISN